MVAKSRRGGATVLLGAIAPPKPLSKKERMTTGETEACQQIEPIRAWEKAVLKKRSWRPKIATWMTKIFWPIGGPFYKAERLCVHLDSYLHTNTQLLRHHTCSIHIIAPSAHIVRIFFIIFIVLYFCGARLLIAVNQHIHPSANSRSFSVLDSSSRHQGAPQGLLQGNCSGLHCRHHYASLHHHNFSRPI